jgi:hypothetical protein
MKAIVLTDDELRVIEKRFGPEVRQMGPWSSDGTFGYSSVSVIAVERAAEGLEDPNLTIALSCLTETPDGSRRFIELLETYGPVLIGRIVAAYRECLVELSVRR